jgi:multiple sugar transport system ATP-binding protein
MAEIILKNIVKEYGDGFKAVKDVSLDIRDGEFMILVGPSGCGKSTVLRMIVGLEDITTGDLLINGQRVNGKAPRDRNLAMVFQNYALYPHLTVYENIAFPLRLQRGRRLQSQIDAKVRHAAGLLELGEHLNRKPANLSGGQRQRVAMGRALVRDVDAFLFDEPLSNLDAKLRGQMRTEIARIQRRLGTTTVYVTHDQTEAMTLGDRVSVLRKGELQQCASPRELYEQPVNLFVAGFIGSPPMNFLPGRVEPDVLHLPIGDVPLPESHRAAVQGKELVIAGIRPEHFSDASMLDRGRRADQVVSDASMLDRGRRADQVVPDAAVRAKLEELDRDLDGEGMRTQLVVTLDATSRVRDGDRVRLAFDPRRMHLFDPESGVTLTRDEDAAARLDRENEDLRRQSLERVRKAAVTHAPATTPQ